MNTKIDAQKFRPAFWTLFAFYSFVGFLTASSYACYHLIETLHFHFFIWIKTIGLGCTGALGLSALFHFLSSVSISTEGICGHSAFGKRLFVRWDEIEKARKFKFPTMPWMMVFTKDGKVLWLPLFQSNKIAFRDAIQDFAPAGSPVLEIIWTSF